MDMAKNRPQNRNPHPTGQSLPDQIETKENPDKPIPDEDVVVTKEDEHPEAPDVPVETKSDDTDPGGKEPSDVPPSSTASPNTTRTTSGPSSGAADQGDYYYRGNTRIIRAGGRVTFRGERRNNKVVVLEEVVQEAQSPTSKRASHYLLYFKGQQLNMDQAERIAN